MSQQQIPPRFFITHSWKDIDFTRRLCDDLRTSGLDGFFDAYSIKPGDVVSAEISRGLEACDIYVPILSHAALKSPWCEEEINAAITLGKLPGRNGRPRIIPVLVEDCQDEMPIFLRSRLYISFAGRYQDALNELLTKGFGVISKLPSSPMSEMSPPLSPQTIKSTPPIFLPLRTWIAVGGGALGIFVLCVLIVCFVAQFFAASAPTPTRIAQATATPTLPPGTPTSTARFTLTPVPALGIGSTQMSADGAVMVSVPAGESLMGSNDADRDGQDNEKPQHTVYLDAFWIDKYEVTNALYKKCVDTGKCSAPSDTQSHTRSSYYGNSTYDNYPVIYVSWNDAKNFCVWAGKRLPTEAEWEKATRSADSRIYPWGNNFDGARLNSWDSTPRVGDTTAVGSYAAGASPYGAMDMAGNVWEWVADWYDSGYYKNSPSRNPMGPSSGQFKVLRGGSWGDPWYYPRAAERLYFTPVDRKDGFGFRCAQ